VAYEEMNKFYGISDIGLSYIPKDENYNYNPPLKTYEYLACSLACVATNTKSNTYIIKNKVNGIIVNDTALDIAQAVVELLKNTENLSFIKKNARASIKNNDFDIITKNYLLPLYNNLMGNN
jgi:glycosyltransferase involved in cell wall biosynthesis